MPLNLINRIIRERSVSGIPYLPSILRAIPWLALIGLLKWYFSGTRNRAERLMRSKIIMMTGGTSGIGASLARSLAESGAQLILLTSQPPSDPFVADYIDDLRKVTDNEFIWAEQVDLSSLHSIRVFATRWIDNAPPRRLDMVILCAATMTPRFAAPIVTKDGLEPNWGLNYLANFHLLSILSPALRAQPPDRDVRVILATCRGYVGGELRGVRDSKSPLPKGREYQTSKLALMVFGRAFQKHLDAYVRPDKQPNNARVMMVDPGACRTPGTRRWLSGGHLLGLLAYMLLWPVWWLVLKSNEMGAETFLHAAMAAELGRGEGGKLLRECREAKVFGESFEDDKIAEQLWKMSEGQIAALEKEDALRRSAEKKKAEQKGKIKDGERVVEITDEKDSNGSLTTGSEAKNPGSKRSRRAK